MHGEGLFNSSLAYFLASNTFKANFSITWLSLLCLFIHSANILNTNNTTTNAHNIYWVLLRSRNHDDYKENKTRIITFELLLQARHQAEHFASWPFPSLSSPVRWMLLSPRYREGSWGGKKWSNLPEDIQLINVGTRFRLFGSQTQALNHYTDSSKGVCFLRDGCFNI